jgi:AcrR family transcriptional regulator
MPPTRSRDAGQRRGESHRAVPRPELHPRTSPYDARVRTPPELPQITDMRTERIDAVRNRAAITEAAERTLRDQGAEAITMDRLACEAGGGKGTLFRRVGDRASLFHALLDESERRLQQRFIRGPALLEPGAPPAVRLIAFGQAFLSLIQGRKAGYRAYVSYLLRELEPTDPDYLADVLMVALAPELVLSGWERLLRKLLA